MRSRHVSNVHVHIGPHTGFQPALCPPMEATISVRYLWQRQDWNVNAGTPRHLTGIATMVTTSQRRTWQWSATTATTPTVVSVLGVTLLTRILSGSTANWNDVTQVLVYWCRVYLRCLLLPKGDSCIMITNVNPKIKKKNFCQAVYFWYSPFLVSSTSEWMALICQQYMHNDYLTHSIF